MIYYQKGGKNNSLSSQDLEEGLYLALDKIGNKKNVLAIPPDFTRFHSKAGELTKSAWSYYGNSLKDILPALGTHFAMSKDEISTMFPGVPHDLFRPHNWRKDVVTIGEVPGEYLYEVSGGKVKYPWPAQVNKLLVEGGHDLILSLGQVVPHEVIGMANYNKNIFVGTGGAEGINKSHFLGAAYGIENILGKADTPVRRILNYASNHFAKNLPIVYVLTVVGRGIDGKLHTRGLFIGDDEECFLKASALSLEVNFQLLETPPLKMVVYLDPSEYKSTWLGNKSIYRTRMAIADGGELIILAPGLREFGEDSQIDQLIRKYGYLTPGEILSLTSKNEDLQNNLSAAAHLIHGSTENRFTVTYCPGSLTRKEIESVNYKYGDLQEMLEIYNPCKLKEGYNTDPGGSSFFYISNPAIGLWAHKNRFK